MSEQGRSDRWTGLLTRAQGGDGSAFAALTDGARPALWARAYARLGDEGLADDAAAEAFAKAWHNRANFDPRRSGGRTWLYTILDRLVLDALDARRRQRRREAGSLDALAAEAGEEGEAPAAAGPEDDVEPAPPEEADRAFRRALVEEALGRLDEADRALLVLREVEGRSYEEIAALLGCTLQAVGPRLTRARERFRDVLHPEAGP
jgi:RNA polymerase sigma-70 factor (ECF subfamily)